MRSHFDYLLRRGRGYYIARGYTYSFDAKVVVETTEPIYPYRPTEVRLRRKSSGHHIRSSAFNAELRRIATKREREILGERMYTPSHFHPGVRWLKPEYAPTEEQSRVLRRLGPRTEARLSGVLRTDQRVWEIHHWSVPREFPCQDKAKWVLKTGRFQTWLKPDELEHALAHGHLVEFHEAIIRANHPKASTKWARARREALKRYGHRCAACGKTGGKLHVDHIKPWAQFPELRYDAENLRVLCPSCHAENHGWLS